MFQNISTNSSNNILVGQMQQYVDNVSNGCFLRHIELFIRLNEVCFKTFEFDRFSFNVDMEFALGGLAACGACFFTNPLDVVKTRMQLQVIKYFLFSNPLFLKIFFFNENLGRASWPRISCHLLQKFPSRFLRDCQGKPDFIQRYIT